MRARREPLIGMPTLDDSEAPEWLLERASYCLTAGPDHCWIWTGSVLHRFGGQGGERAVVKRPGRNTRNVGRVLWEELRGALPRSIVVRHRCDDGLCVRPSHLLPGTHRDNTDDARQRGRLRPGGSPAHDLTG